MSYRVIHQARWTCDGCGAVTVATDDALPAGWMLYVVALNVPGEPDAARHYCPPCYHQGVPPSENETTRNG